MKKLVRPERGGGRNPNPVYIAEVYGEINVMKNGVLQPVAYEYSFKFLHSMLQERSALSIFKNEVAPLHFPQLFPGFQAVLTHYLREVQCPEDPRRVAENPVLLNRVGLIEFIDDYGLPVEAPLYQDDDQLRQAVLDCIDDEEVFVIQQRRRKEKYGTSAEVRAALMELNPIPTLAQAAEARAAMAVKEAEASLVQASAPEEVAPPAPPAVQPDMEVLNEDLSASAPPAAVKSGKKGSKSEADEV